MTDINYKMLQWSKEIMDEIVEEKEKYSKRQLVELIQKMSSNFHLILLSESKNYSATSSEN